MSNNQNTKTHCWAEDKLYLVWQLIHKANSKDVFNFNTFIIYKDEWSYRRECKGFLKTLEEFDVKLTDLDFDYDFYIEEDKEMGTNYVHKLQEKCNGKKWKTNVENILQNKFSYEDLKKYLEEAEDNSLLYYIDFKFNIDNKKIKEFKEEISKYLNAFIEDNLYSDKQNIFTFDIHKKSGFEAVYSIYDKYGDHFIIDQEYKDNFRNKEFLFLHFFLALDRLGYLKIQNIEYVKGGSLSFLEEVFKVRVLLLDSFFENTIRKEEKTKPKDVKQTDYKDGNLKIEGQTIDFKDKPNQKELLDILFSEPNKEWYYDEIQEKWDEHGEFPDNYWRKFYTAGDGINTNIARLTTISDFIKKNTKQIWLNKKYLANS